MVMEIQIKFLNSVYQLTLLPHVFAIFMGNVPLNKGLHFFILLKLRHAVN